MMQKKLCVSLWLLVLLAVPAGAHGKEQQEGSSLAAERAERERRAASQLNGTTWTVDMTPLSGEKAQKPLKDTLTFDAGKVTSQVLSRDGYPTSNYTLTIHDDGAVVWETMQTKEGAGVAFWRGERHGDTMRGILSRHPAEGASLDYSFSGTAAASEAPQPTTTPLASTSPGVTPVPAAPATAPAGPSSPATPVTTQPQPAEAAAAPAASAAAQPLQQAAPAEKKTRKGW